MDSTRRLLWVLLLAALLASCQIAPEKPATPSTIVTLGDSMTMGIQDAGLVADNQYHCYPYLLAKQMGQAEGFRQPLVNEPGIGVPPYERPLWLEDGMVEARYLDEGITQQELMMLIMGRLANLFWPDPYNNLGVNGARLDDLNHATGYASSVGKNLFYDIVLRNLDAPLPDFGDTTAVDQAVMRDPQYITLWIGNNDILGYVLGGGEDSSLITGTSLFRTELEATLTQLTNGVPDAKIVVANIPQYLPFGYALDRVFGADGKPKIFDPATLEPIDFDPDAGEELYIDLHVGLEDGGTVEHLLLQAAAYYLEDGMGIDPADLDDTQEALLESKGVPIPTARVELTKDLVITDEEESLALTKIAAFNTIIAEVAADFDVPMVDINSWMKPGAPDSPLPGDSCFGFALVSPATTIFSLDGVHANNYGHAFIANEFIKTMNAEFTLSMPLLDPEDYKGQYLGANLVPLTVKALRRLQEMYTPKGR